MDISPTKNSNPWANFGNTKDATSGKKIGEMWNYQEGDYYLCISMEVCDQNLLQYLETLTPENVRQDKHLLWVAQSLENMADAVCCIHKKCKIPLINRKNV